MDIRHGTLVLAFALGTGGRRGIACPVGRLALH